MIKNVYYEKYSPKKISLKKDLTRKSKSMTKFFKAKKMMKLPKL